MKATQTKGKTRQATAAPKGKKTNGGPKQFDVVEETEYNSHPVLLFKAGEDDPRGVMMGAQKIRAVLQNVKRCEKWLAEQDAAKAAKK